MAELTLEDVLKVCPEISNFEPSEYVCKEVSGKIIKIGENSFEIRMFSFQGSEEKTFNDFATKEGIETFKWQLYDNGYAKFHTFTQTPAQKSKGIFFVLPLRQLAKV